MGGQFKIIGPLGNTIVSADGFYIGDGNTLILYQEMEREDYIEAAKGLLRPSDVVINKGPTRMQNVAAFQRGEWSKIYEISTELEN